MRLLDLTDQSGVRLWVGADALICAEPARGELTTLTLLTGGPSPYTRLLVRETAAQLAALVPRGPGGRAVFLLITNDPTNAAPAPMLVNTNHIVTGGQSAKRNVLIMQGGLLISTRSRVGPLLAREG